MNEPIHDELIGTSKLLEELNPERYESCLELCDLALEASIRCVQNGFLVKFDTYYELALRLYRAEQVTKKGG